MLLGVRNAAGRLKAFVGDVWVQTETCVRDVPLRGVSWRGVPLRGVSWRGVLVCWRGVSSLVQTCCCAGRFISALQTPCITDDEFPITSQLKFLILGFGSVVTPSVNCYFGKFD